METGTGATNGVYDNTESQIAILAAARSTSNWGPSNCTRHQPASLETNFSSSEALETNGNLNMDEVK